MKNLTFLVVCFIPLFINAQYTLRDNDVVVTNGIIESCSYDFAIKDIIIPETLDGQTVTGIGNNSYNLFQDKGITSVQLPSTLELIGSAAFFVNNLTSITIPNSVTSINDWAFCMNNLTSVTFEANSYIGGIGKYAFYSNPGFSGITLPTHANPDFINYTDGTGKTYSPGDAITNFTTNYYVDIPYALTDNDVVVSSGIIESCSYDFALKVIIIPETLDGQIISGISDKFTDSDGIFSTKGIAKVTLPSSLEFIGDFAFSRNSLTSVIIPNSVTSVGSHTFFDNSLTNVTISNNMTLIGRHAFRYNKLISVVIPNSVISIGSSAFAENKLSSITIPNSVTSIDDYAFYVNSLTSVTFETNSNIGSISESAFASNSGLSSVTLPTHANPRFVEYADGNGNIYSPGDAITDFTINYYANIEEIQPAIEVTAGNLKTLLGDQLSTITSLYLTGTIDARDFKTMRDEMPLLAEIDLSGVTIVEYTGTEGTSVVGNTYYPSNTIPEFAFENENWQGKNSLISIILPESIIAVDAQAFTNCNGLTSINIPLSVITIGNNAFASCNKLNTVSIPASVTLIGNGAFTGCPGLITVNSNNPNYSSIDGILFNKTQTELIKFPLLYSGDYTIPSTVINIIGYSFYACRLLTSITFPNSVVSIKWAAFANCTSLTEVIIPSSATNLERYAFQNCNSLISVIIPSSVISIGGDVFQGCTSLNTIYNYSTNPVNLSSVSNVFGGVNKTTCTLYVPFGSKPAYQAANQWQDFQNIIEMPGFSLSSTTATLEATEGSTTTLSISSDVIWTATSDQSWLTIDPTTGSGNEQTVTFTATEANPSATPRIATVTISAEGIEPQTIIVTQAGSNVAIEVTAGNLINLFTPEQLATLTKLTLTGTIDARDFKTMRDNMPLLAEIDLSEVNILAYSGTQGTSIWGNNNYPANTIPEFAFMNSSWQGKNSLTSITFPTTLVSFGQYAIAYCNGLTNVSVPPSVTTIGNSVFYNSRGMISIFIPQSVTSIGNSAFSYCTGLINVDENNLNYSSIDGILFNKTQTKLIQCLVSKTGSYTIPATVTAIGQGSFAGCNQLTFVTIPTSVITIEYSAFSGCSGISSISIPHSVTLIQSGAFNYFSGLINVDEANLNYSGIGGVLFNKTQTTLIQCPVTKTGSFNIPNSVVTIGQNAFAGCSQLTSVIIPESVKTIDNYAFWFCNNLTSVVIPTSVTKIGNGFFGYCSSLISITVGWPAPPDLSSISQAFYNVNKATCNLYVPFGSKTAYQSANQWKDFTNIVEMPGIFLSANSVGLAINADTAEVSITSSAEWYVTSDQPWLTVNPTSGPIGSGVLILSALANPDNIARNATVTVTATGLEPQTITVTQYGKVEVTAGNLKTLLAGQLATITSLTLTGTIDARDFKTMRDDMPLLSKIDLTETNIVAYNGSEGTSPYHNAYLANTIPYYAFYSTIYGGKTSLTFVALPTSATVINYAAFHECKNLSSVIIPQLISNIENDAFTSSSGDKIVDAANSYYSSLDGVLYNKEQTLLIHCPVSKTGEFVIPSTVTTTGWNSLWNCNKLASVIIPLSVTSIEVQSFWGCSGLSSIEIPTSVNYIGGYTFSLCTGLSSFEFPSSVTSIGDYTFQNCSGLNTVIIPSSITSIGNRAFTNCSALSSIYVYSVFPVDLSNSTTVFNNVNKTTCTLYVPFGSKTAYQAANQWKDFTNIVEMEELSNLAKDSLALVALYNATDGPNWTNNENWLTGPVNTWFGVTVENNRVVGLTLGDYSASNNLDGYLPHEIGNLSELRELKLIGNKSLIGNIPIEIGNLSNLQYLNLYGCGFSGSIPSAIGNLSNLYYLDLQVCNFTGIIPESIKYLTNLKTLWLSNNNFEPGTFPHWITEMSSLTSLNLSVCNITGNIPPELGQLIGLEYLGLGHNQLSGIIPDEICALSSTQFNLSFNNFDSQSCQTIQCLKDNGARFTDSEQLQQSGFSLLNDCNFIEACPQHFHTVWEGTAGTNHMNINVLDAKTDGIDLEPGDEIAVFDNDLCVGYGKVTKTIDQQNILTINVSRDEGSENGFTPGNDISYKFWDCSTETEIIVNNIECFNTLAEPVSCLSFESMSSSFVKLSAISDICQTLNFNSGWNIISIPLNPESEDLVDVFQPLIARNSLVKMQDEGGFSLEDWGIYGGWKNNIGNVSPTEGYKVKVSKEDNFEICGAPVQYPFAITLKSGWNIMGYPQTEAFNALEVLKQLINEGKLVKVQDEGGFSIEDWGIYGGWKNNIGDFVPGKGYNIKLNADATLWINETYPKSSSIQPELIATNHFKPAFVGNGLDHMNINLIGLPNNVLRAGDELAVFDGTTCVGAVTLTSLNINNQSVSIAASAKDNQGMAGFAAGNPIMLKLWNSKQNTEFILEPEIVKGTSTFAKHETTVASLEKYTATGLGEISAFDLTEINCYPNPFSDELNIEIRLVKDSEVQVEVLNQLGQRVLILQTEKMLNSGVHRLTWNGRNTNNGEIAPGIYHIKIEIDDSVVHRKIVFSK